MRVEHGDAARPFGVFAFLAATFLTLPPRAVLAQDKGVEVSVGYAFAKSLGEGEGSAPLGAYLSLAGTRRLSFAVDVGWQRDSEETSEGTSVLNTFTATAGPRLRVKAGGARPFLHLLGGVRFDRTFGVTNTSWGGQTGGGVDLSWGGSTTLRLMADVQVFVTGGATAFSEGDTLKTLRLGMGLTF